MSQPDETQSDSVLDQTILAYLREQEKDEAVPAAVDPEKTEPIVRGAQLGDPPALPEAVDVTVTEEEDDWSDFEDDVPTVVPKGD